MADETIGSESYPDYLARKAAAAAAEADEQPMVKKAKGAEDKAIKATDGKSEDKAEDKAAE
jgi:hypothetical protein